MTVQHAQSRLGSNNVTMALNQSAHVPRRRRKLNSRRRSPGSLGRSLAQTRVVAHQAAACAVELELGCAIPGASPRSVPRISTRPPGPRRPSRHKHCVPAAQSGRLRHSTLSRTRLLCLETPVSPHKLGFCGTIWCFAAQTLVRTRKPELIPTTPRFDCLPV